MRAQLLALTIALLPAPSRALEGECFAGTRRNVPGTNFQLDLPPSYHFQLGDVLWVSREPRCIGEGIMLYTELFTRVSREVRPDAQAKLEEDRRNSMRGLELSREAQRLDIAYQPDGQHLWSEALVRLPCLAAARGQPIEHLMRSSILGSWKYAFDHAGQTLVLFPVDKPASAPSQRAAGSWRVETDGPWLAAFRPGWLVPPRQLSGFLDEAEALVKKPRG